MNIKMDFKSDWHSILKEVMSRDWGMDVTEIDEDVPVFFFNALHRRIQPRPRKVFVADDFECPQDLQLGWERVKAKVENGSDLAAHLSKQINQAMRTDALLNDWGTHHFHLGIKVKKGWVNRTGKLLFARVTHDAFYVIGIYDHEAFADSDIVETLHRNWPETIAQWRMWSTSDKPLTQEQREVLRNKHINAHVLTSDGTTYGPIGGGMVTSGHNVSAVMQMDVFHDRLERLEERLREIAPQIEPHLLTRGYETGAEVTAKMQLLSGYYSAFFPNYNLTVNFYPREAGEGGVQF
ncbi:hypothetical protein [Pseudomonas putida]|uniref:hypothetical protein n=1 Tax=Pseudomonas putida TaxID=303 RepID=UPI0023632FB3|nr:hypothetical protein [Pseudomonas putida]MDD1989979.1 hypothetical protein [Pseudomonas putida]HDS1796127.1 hypothetical protein [Pseudomonas putida]